MVSECFSTLQLSTSPSDQSTKGNNMAIALNTSRNHSFSARGESFSRPSVVPPASVWEPSALGHDSTRRISATEHVRTLSPIDRTQGRDVRRVESAAVARCRGENRLHGGSNVGNYVLGAVFGAAVFIGTVWGGLSIDGQAPSAPSATQDVAAASQ